MNAVSISVARRAVIDEHAAYIMDEQGYLYLSGRKHAVINHSGFRIIPEEVERVLQEVSGVECVVVVGMEHPERGKSVRKRIRRRSEDYLRTAKAV